MTKYFYGVTLSNSDLASNELLRSVIYPDSSDTDPTGTDQVKFTYNRQQEIVTRTDQIGNVRTFEYDNLGRLTHDRVTTFGTGTDQSVKRISRTYEVRGLPEKITSYDNATVGSGTVVNEVQRAYNSFQQLTTEYQSHSGAVNTSTSPKVQYGYANGSANTIRPTSLTYPNGRFLTYGYGTGGGASDKLSRIEVLIDDDASSTRFVEYSFLGRDRTVIANYTQPGVELTYYTSGGSGDAGDQYTGFDRFGRVTDQRWRKTSDNSDRERVKYGFNRASNRTWRQNTVAGTGQDEFYTYDNLYQLKTLDRGTLNAGKTGIDATPSWEEDWNFDATGNWHGTSTGYLTKTSGTTDLNQNRTNNKANEITDITESVGPAWTTPAYDRNGNATSIPQPGTPTSSYSCTYDAWDRAVTVGSSTYRYDGLNRRVTKDTGTVRHYYYSHQWQILEERTGSSTTADRQFMWGMRYLDDLVVRERTTGSERFYALHDYFNCTAIVDTSGSVQERYGYDAYGKVRFMTSAFASRSSSSYDWETLYATYRWDSESGLYQVRNRYLHPKVGVWTTRDPLEYESERNLYVYAGGRPINVSDPSGAIADFLRWLSNLITFARCDCGKGSISGNVKFLSKKTKPIKFGGCALYVDKLFKIAVDRFNSGFPKTKSVDCEKGNCVDVKVFRIKLQGPLSITLEMDRTGEIAKNKNDVACLVTINLALNITIDVTLGVCQI